MAEKKITEQEAAQRLRKVKVGEQFTVSSNSDRMVYSKTALTLKRAGIIGFQIVTKQTGDGRFVIVAIP